MIELVKKNDEEKRKMKKEFDEQIQKQESDKEKRIKELETKITKLQEELDAQKKRHSASKMFLIQSYKRYKNYIFEIWATLPRVQRRSKVTASLCIFTVSDKCIQSDPEREPGMRKERYSTTSYSCNTFSRVIQPNTVTLHTNTLHCTLVLYMYQYCYVVVRCSSSWYSSL